MLSALHVHPAPFEIPPIDPISRKPRPRICRLCHKLGVDGVYRCDFCKFNCCTTCWQKGTGSIAEARQTPRSTASEVVRAGGVQFADNQSDEGAAGVSACVLRAPDPVHGPVNQPTPRSRGPKAEAACSLESCKLKANFRCSICSKSTCVWHGDANRFLCDNCLQSADRKASERASATTCNSCSSSMHTQCNKCGAPVCGIHLVAYCSKHGQKSCCIVL